MICPLVNGFFMKRFAPSLSNFAEDSKSSNALISTMAAFSLTDLIFGISWVPFQS
jgi:hypothetical protein